MVHGFYDLASGMLTEKRNLDVISSNMSNVVTKGFKADKLVSSTFREELMSRTGNMDKKNTQPIGNSTMARIPRETITDFSQGAFSETGNKLDFALEGDAFFRVRTPQGAERYTRNGSFNMDNEGYICTQQGDRVMGKNGPIRADNPNNGIMVSGDALQVDNAGNIYTADGNYIDTFDLVTFDDKQALTKQDGFFVAGGQPRPANAGVRQGALEGSNVEPVKEMVAMMESQRHLQSASQVLKIYDQLMGKATNDIGRI